MLQLSALRTGFLCTLCSVFLAALPSETRAQSTDTVKPAPKETSTEVQPSPSTNENPPPGGCMPIGITVSGEVVFPFLCKDFLDRHKAAKESSAVPQNNRDSVQENAAAKRPDTEAAPPATEASEPRAATPATKPPATTVSTPATNPTESVYATPEIKTPETTASTPATKSPESVSATPDTKPPESTATTPDIKAPENISASPEINPLEAPTPSTKKPSKPLAFKAEIVRSADSSALAKGSPGCTHFRTYNPESHTYRAYNGQRRSCP